MLPNLFVFQVMVVSKATDLKTVSGSNKYGVPSFLQLVLDWYKERNMRGIIEIYPNLFVFLQMIQFTFISLVVVTVRNGMDFSPLSSWVRQLGRD